MKKKASEKIVIGWREDAHLPDWDIWDLPTKVDTGARTSSLHVEDIQRLPKNRVKFSVIIDDRKPEKTVTIIENISRAGNVRTNAHHVQNRFFVKTRLRLGPVEKEIEINLTDRSDLRFRFILGRTALSKNFLINAGKGKLATG